jgi:acetolactate synthase-1/2/3 large subunit
MSTYADVVAAVLADAGIEFIFGVPGSLSSVELIEAASKRGIRYVLTSNESSAAVMAGTYGALRNRPGVVSTGVGPGAASALHGVAHVFMERQPALVLTDRYGDAEFRRLLRQRLFQDQLYRPITKATMTLAADNAAATVQRAIDLAMTGRQGPVHIDLPYDVMLAEASESDFPSSNGSRGYFNAGLDQAGLRAAAEAIEGAQKPAVIVGLQVTRAGKAAERAFQAFAEQMGAPVFASLMGKGTLPEQHPLAAGTFRGAPNEKALLDQADLLVLIGFDPVEIFTPGYWNYQQPVVMLDEVRHLEGIIRPKVEVVSALAEGLQALTEMLPERSRWNREDIDAYKQQRAQLLRPKGEGLMPAAVVRIARERLPENGIMTVDAGQHKVLTCDLWETRRTRGLLSSSGLGTMAVALPCAIAAKLVEPTAPVLCLTGDGGFIMRAGDLETAAREGLPIVVVVFNDRTLNLIKLQQDRRGVQRLGTAFAECDFAGVARGFGFEATRVDSEEALDAALAEAFASGKPWLIDAAINPEGYV